MATNTPQDEVPTTPDNCLRARGGPGTLVLTCARNQRLLFERSTPRVNFYGVDDSPSAQVTTTPCDLPDCCQNAPKAAPSFTSELRKLLAGLVSF